ncbi:MAG: terminase small subunit, partial [Mailhella sp.]
MLKDPEVAAAIEKAEAERSRRTQIEADRVVLELAKIAFADPRDLMDWGPEGVEVKASGTIPPDAAASVGEVSVQGRNVKVKMLDKLKALELLGRHLGMFTDKVEAEVKQEAKVILFGGE